MFTEKHTNGQQAAWWNFITWIQLCNQGPVKKWSTASNQKPSMCCLPFSNSLVIKLTKRVWYKQWDSRGHQQTLFESMSWNEGGLGAAGQWVCCSKGLTSTVFRDGCVSLHSFFQADTPGRGTGAIDIPNQGCQEMLCQAGPCWVHPTPASVSMRSQSLVMPFQKLPKEILRYSPGWEQFFQTSFIRLFSNPFLWQIKERESVRAQDGGSNDVLLPFLVLSELILHSQMLLDFTCTVGQNRRLHLPQPPKLSPLGLLLQVLVSEMLPSSSHSKLLYIL